MKLGKQLAALAAAAALFAGFDAAFYNIFTKRYINDTSPEMQARSIEVSRYLPFVEDSDIVKINSSDKLSGKLPVLDGAAALFPVFSGFVNSFYPPESVTFENGDFTADSALQFRNTRGAYKAVVDGTADVVFCAEPSAEQLEYATENGVELELVPIGREAFVFIVNKDNPADDLTVEQVRGIYSGEIKKWSEVGGDDRYIDALQRNTGSGSQTAMLSFMGDVPMKRGLTGIFGSAIGFSFRYYVEGIVENSSVKMLSLNGVYPSAENVANESYPIVSNFFAVYRKGDDPNIQALIDLILSDAGQRIVKESGYAPLR